MKINFGTSKNPSALICLNGDEVAQAIFEFLKKREVYINLPMVLTVNDEICSSACVFVSAASIIKPNEEGK